jgi:hypothetical protein
VDRRRRSRWVPPQHGAWAMLAVPYLTGLLVAGFRWPDLPLLGAWIAGYLLSYQVFLALKSRRLSRYRRQIVVYTAVAAPLAALTVLARPTVLWYGPAYALLFAVNAWYAYRRRERTVLNDVASVGQSCLMVFVVATVARADAVAALEGAALTAAYFLGTVVHVKAMIRERGNPAYHRWSISYHAAVLPLAALISPWAVVFFGWLLARAAVLPRRGARPVGLGLVEIGNSVVLLGVVALMATI